MATTKAPPKKPIRRPQSATSPKPREEVNVAPSQWGRRLARLVGQKFGVKMVANHAKNEGTFGRRDIVIKCAKSIMPPISVLTDMLERLDDVWAVYILPDGTAQIWSITAQQVREHAYFTRGRNVQKRAELYLRKIEKIGKLVGTLSEEDVDSCKIP